MEDDKPMVPSADNFDSSLRIKNLHEYKEKREAKFNDNDSMFEF